MNANREFERTFLPLRPLVERVVMSRCKMFLLSADIGEDVIQDTMLTCYRACEKPTLPPNPQAFALGAAKVILTRYNVERGSRQETELQWDLPHRDAPPSLQADDAELTPEQTRQRAALASLTEAERDLLNGAHVGNIPLQQLAQQAGVETALEVSQKMRYIHGRLRRYDAEKQAQRTAHKNAASQMNAALLAHFNPTHQAIIADVLAHPTPRDARREVAAKYGLTKNAMTKIMVRYRDKVLAA